jgi:predicted ThiF/HesA family dinucleotide-utilizing enzyme
MTQERGPEHHESKGPPPLVPSLPENTSVKIIGLGGVGGRLAADLAVLLSSLNASTRLVLIDGDHFEAANAARMTIPEYGNKAAVLRAELARRCGDSRLSILAVEEFVGPDNISRLIQEGDIVLVAVDNHSTRKLVSDFCAAHRGDICLISGGNDGVGKDASGATHRGTYGNVQIYLRRDGVDTSPSLSTFHPEIAHPTDRLPGDVGCGQQVASQPQLLVTNAQTATAMLAAFWLHICGALPFDELGFDVAEGLMRPVKLPVPAGTSDLGLSRRQDRGSPSTSP